MIDDTAIIIPEATEATVQDSIPEPEVTQSKPESIQAKNFRELKSQAEKIAQERDELRKRLQSYESTQTASKVTKETIEDDEEVYLDPDQIAEGKHLAKFGRKIKKLEEKLQKADQQTAIMVTQARLNQEMPDFEKVVTTENVKTLQMTYPHIAAALGAATDPYVAGKSAYDLIKQFGIHTTTQASEVAENVIKQNLSKPKVGAAAPSQQGGLSPMARTSDHYAGDLTDEMKKIFYQELLEAKMRR